MDTKAITSKSYIIPKWRIEWKERRKKNPHPGNRILNIVQQWPAAISEFVKGWINNWNPTKLQAFILVHLKRRYTSNAKFARKPWDITAVAIRTFIHQVAAYEGLRQHPWYDARRRLLLFHQSAYGHKWGQCTSLVLGLHYLQQPLVGTRLSAYPR